MPTVRTVSPKTPALAFLKKHHACPEAVQWAEENKIRTLGKAWLKCENPQWMLWALDVIGYNDEKLRLFACWCAREMPLPDGRKHWDLLTDEHSRKAVEVAEQFARGKATLSELSAAGAAARAAVGAAAGAAARAAWAAAGAVAWSAAWAAERAAVWSAAGAVAGLVAWSAAWAAAGAAQAKALRRIVKPFRTKARALDRGTHS